MIVNVLDDLSVLPDIAPRKRALLKKIAGERIIDVLCHLPHNINDRRRKSFFKDCEPGTYCTLVVEVSFHVPSHALRKPAKIVCTDGQDKIELLYFNTSKHYLTRVAPSGSRVVISGKIEFDAHQRLWQMIHPDHIGGIETLNHWVGVEAVYRLTTGLTQSMLREAIHKALAVLPRFPEWHTEEMLVQHKWPAFHQCLHLLHNPISRQELLSTHPARLRLMYDEFLAQQINFQIIRQQHFRVKGTPLKCHGELVEQLAQSLPFVLTQNQKEAYVDIVNDMNQSKPMLRLLQGDVGSGKTIVALMAMLYVAECGKQAAILAPTEILARQHYGLIKRHLEPLGIKVEILTNREKGRVRQNILEGIEAGTIQVIIGTHSIIQESVRFKKLALVVIDEQHRFGVEQRLALSQKGKNPHILTMTATPIPRTLTMANYGEMDVSLIREKPEGRQEVQTKLVSLKQLDKVLYGIQKFIEKGQKIYWVCPLVEESDNFDFSSATERFESLQKIYGKKVGVMHGKMRGVDKDIVMDQFIRGHISIVVATTVIEVGVDVPDATLMIIEHAERFGLSQLHQLRGRVGRSHKSSTCILMYGDNLSAPAQKRLEVMRESNDGFYIAEIDAKLRGPGDRDGTKQSGMVQFIFSDFGSDDWQKMRLQQGLLEDANMHARKIFDDDPAFEGPQSHALKLLLQVFKKDTARRLRQAG